MKTPMLGLAAFSAIVLLGPSFASATPAHINIAPETTAIHGVGPSIISRVAGNSFLSGETTSGSGNFENTTTGTLDLTFHGGSFGTSTCGTMSTTALSFHLVMLETNKPGVLLTPGPSGHFATLSCFGLVIKGNGLLGTITLPKCGADSNTITVQFTGSEGVQDHLTYTGEKYTLESRLFFQWSQTALNTEMTIYMDGGDRELICTH
jgi:hypothetical protein